MKMLIQSDSSQRLSINEGLSVKETIVLVGPSPFLVGGVATHVSQILASDLGKRYKIVHYGVGKDEAKGSSVKRIINSITAPLRLLIRAKASSAKIVHLNTSMDFKSYVRDSVCMLFARLCGCEVIYQVHGGAMPLEYFRNWPIFHILFRMLMKIPDKVVVLTSVAKKAYEEYVPHSTLALVPNAIDLELFKGIDCDRVQKDEFTIGYIGRLADNKGIFEALEAISMLKESELSITIKFKIAGKGPSEKALKRRTAELKIEDKVDFLGAVFGKEKTLFWQELDLFLFPTYHREGLPYVILESLASGTPVITTPIAGIPDAIESGRHGLFVRPKDVDDITRALKKIIGDTDMRLAMVHNCLQKAEQNYGIKRLVRQFGKVYEELLSR